MERHADCSTANDLYWTRYKQRRARRKAGDKKKDKERHTSKAQIRDKTRDRAVRSTRHASSNLLPLQNSFCSITCFPPFSLRFFHVVNDASTLLFILAFSKINAPFWVVNVVSLWMSALVCIVITTSFLHVVLFVLWKHISEHEFSQFCACALDLKGTHWGTTATHSLCCITRNTTEPART